MQYRTLGKTGMEVSDLSFGASSLGSVFRDINEEEGVNAVHTSLDLGVNLIDVSPYYGLTKAETVLGKALKGIKRDRYYLTSKAGRYGQNEFDFSAARMKSSVDESLQRLGVDYLDVLFLHDIEFVDLRQIVEVTIPAINELKKQGKIRFSGISGFPLKIFREVISQIHVDCILSYSRYALNDTSLLDLFPFLEKQGVGLMSASPLNMGLFSPRGAPCWHPADLEVIEACNKAVQFCKDQEQDIAKLAVQYSLQNESIPTTLVGSASAANMRRNIAWAEEKLDETLLQEVKKILAPIHNQSWASGLPVNN